MSAADWTPGLDYCEPDSVPIRERCLEVRTGSPPRSLHLHRTAANNLFLEINKKYSMLIILGSLIFTRVHILPVDQNFRNLNYDF